MSMDATKIIIKRIVAVDSSSMAYAEAFLNDNILLMGLGNVGKSSLVNAVRFFLLPDTNVNQAKDKFAFRSGAESDEKKSYYDKDELYNYYFPTVHSRLILEVEHQLLGGGVQSHCQIISRGGDYKIQRVFIPEPYEAIEHLFWQKDDANGTRPENPVGSDLMPRLREINKNAKQYSQRDQLMEALYTFNAMDPASTPFAIFPLNNIRANSVDSVRALVKMLFNQDAGSLRLMTATAVEAQDAFDETLEIDISEIIGKKRELTQRKEQLARLRALEPQFIELQEQFSRLQQKNAATAQFISLYQNTKAHCHSLEEHADTIGRRVETLNRKCTTLGQQKQNALTDMQASRKVVARLNKEIEQKTAIKHQCDQIIASYPDEGISFVLNSLKDYLQEKRSDYKNRTEQNTRERRITELGELIKGKEQQLEKTKAKIRDKSKSLHAQLPEPLYNKLYSVNSTLAKANPGRDLTEDELSQINGFCELLIERGGSLEFFDEKIELLSEPYQDITETDITGIENELFDLKEELKELKEHNTNAMNDARKIEALAREIKSTESDIEKIEGYTAISQALSSATTDYEQEIKDRDEYAELHQELEAAYERDKSEFTRLRSELSAAQDKARALSMMISQYHNAICRFPAAKARLDGVLAGEEESPAGEKIGDEESFQRTLNALQDAANAKDKIRLKLIELIKDGLISDDYQLLERDDGDDAVVNTFNMLAQKFELLSHNSDVLAQDTRRHNEHIRNRLERLSKTKDKIETTVSQINRDIEGASMNDIEEARLVVELEPLFNSLVDSWRNFDSLNTENTLPFEWYDMLQRFVDSKAVSEDDGKLRLNHLIQGTSYETRKAGASWDSKKQSTSTHMLINTHFCDIFLDKLASQSANIAFPLIVDEIGSIDTTQIPELLATLNSKGHYLIGVTVDGKSGAVFEAIGSYQVFTRDNLTTHPYSKERRNTAIPRFREYLSVEHPNTPPSQSSLEV